MTDNNVPLLTAEDAERIQSYFDFYNIGLEAIVTERARVCPVRTEAEWREEFNREFGRPYGYAREGIIAWLAALRHLNLVAPEPSNG